MKVPPLFKRQNLSYKNAVLPLFKRQNLSYKNAVLPLFKRRALIVNSLIFACKGRYYIKNSAYKIGSKNNKNSSYRSYM